MRSQICCKGMEHCGRPFSGTCPVFIYLKIPGIPSPDGLLGIGGTDKSVPYNIYTRPGNHALTAAHPSPVSFPFDLSLSLFYVGNGFDRSVFPNPRAFPFMQNRRRYHPGEQQAGFVCNRRNGQIRSLQYSHNKFAYRKPCTDHRMSVIRLISVQPFHYHYFM